jgi:hypothetical protein
MTRSRTDDLLEILQEHYNRDEEGWLWMASFFEADEKGILNEFAGAYSDPVQSARGLAHIINALGAQAFLALCRVDGRPREIDRELWRELRSQASPDLLVDMVVFDKDHAWSMRAEDTAAAV